MRKLTAPDMFAGIRMIKKYGLKEQARELAANSDTAADLWAQGYEIAWALFDKLTTEGGEQDLYKFLSGPFEMSVEDVQALPLSDLIANIKKLAEENDLVDFFKNAAGLMK